MDKELIKEYINSGLVLIPKNGKKNIKGVIDSIFKEQKVNVFAGDSVALVCELSNCFAFDFDPKGFEDNDLEYVWNVWNAVKNIADDIFKSGYYLETTPSGGEHLIIQCENRIDIKTGKILYKNEKCFLEVKSKGRGGILNIYPTTPLKKLINYTFERIHDFYIEVNNYFKNQNKNIGDFLIEKIGANNIMFDLGYSKINEKRWDKNPSSTNPSVELNQFDLLIDYNGDEKPKHLGWLYYRRFYNDFKTFIKDNPDFTTDISFARVLKNDVVVPKVSDIEVLYCYFVDGERNIIVSINGIECRLTANIWASPVKFRQWIFNCGLIGYNDNSEISELNVTLSKIIKDKNIKIKDVFNHCKWNDQYIYPSDDYLVPDDFTYFKQSGTSDEWILNVWYPVKNDMYMQLFLLTALCGLYAGDVFNENFGMHLSGTSCSGKSIILNIACSALGNPRTDVIGWRVTQARLVQDVKYFSHSTMCCDDMTNGTSAGIDGILSLLLQDMKRKMHKDNLGNYISSNDEKVPMCLLGNSEQPFEMYLKHHKIPMTRGLLNRYIDLRIKPERRFVDADNFVEAYQATERYYGSISRLITSEVSPQCLKSAYFDMMDEMKPKLDLYKDENKRVLKNFIKLKALAHVIEDKHLIDLPCVQDNIDRCFLDHLNILAFGDTPLNVVEKETMQLLYNCCYDGEHTQIDSRNASVPRKLCILRDIGMPEDIYYLMCQKFENTALYNTSNVTREEFYRICKKYNILGERKQITSLLLNTRIRVRKINLEALEDI